MKKYSLLATGLLLLSHSLAAPLVYAAEVDVDNLVQEAERASYYSGNVVAPMHE